MFHQLLNLAKLRLKLWAWLVLIAVFALGLGIWREYWSPKWAWRRAIHENLDADLAFKSNSDNAAWEKLGRQGKIDGLDRETTIDEVERALVDDHPAVRIRALQRFGTLKLGRRHDLGVFLSGVNDIDPRVRGTVAYHLCQLWFDEPEARQALLRLFDDESEIVRLRVALGLASLTWGSNWTQSRRRGIPELEALQSAIAAKLSDPDLDVRGEAAFRLADMGRDAEAMPVLLEWVRNRKCWGQQVLNGCHPKAIFLKIAHKSDEAVDFLLVEMGKECPDCPTLQPWIVANAVRQRGPWGPEARLRFQDKIVTGLTSPDPRIRTCTAVLLNEIDSSAEILPGLIEATRFGAREIRLSAIQALGERGQGSTEVLTQLQALSSDPDAGIRSDASQVLKILEREAD